MNTSSIHPVQLIECPRDAMQGIHDFIPTQEKTEYLNTLLKVGFDTLDFGSFVSPKAIPQMRDTAEVLAGLDLSQTSTSLLAIVANLRGAEEACAFPQITYLGFPLSLSETFQQRNTNKSISEAFESLAQIQNLCMKHNKTLVVYLSMGFGNPYGDPYSPETAGVFAQKLIDMGAQIISLADTVGNSNPQSIRSLFTLLTSSYPDTTFGVHLHSTPEHTLEKIEAAYLAGCRRFDGALQGIGGCPMASDQLTGNTATELMIPFLESQGMKTGINTAELQKSIVLSSRIFQKYH